MTPYLSRLVLAGALLLTACNSVVPVGSQATADTLRALDNELSKAVTQGDLERIVSFYADDAWLLPAAKPLIAGKEAIRDEWAYILAIPDFTSEASLSRLELSSSADLAYTTGTYVATMLGEDGTQVQEPGKSLTVWKRQSDGMWRIVIDTYNTDIPPPDHR